MLWLLLFVAIAAGAGIPLQAGINAQLAAVIGGPLRAATISFVVGLVALVVISAIFARGTHVRGLAGAPWWVWFGGFFGAFYVTAATLIAPRLGAVTLSLGVVAGQIAMSLVADRFGLVGFKQQALTAPRLAGVGLVLAGVALVRFS
ncbi:MAG: DMT family transporter [Gaiellaceae bacterium]